MSNIVLGNNAMTSAFKNQPRLTGLLQALLTPVDKTMAAEAPAGYQFSIEQALYGIYFVFLLDQKDSDDNWVCTGAQLDVWGRRSPCDCRAVARHSRGLMPTKEYSRINI